MRMPGRFWRRAAHLAFSEEAAKRSAEHPLTGLPISEPVGPEIISCHSVGKGTPSTLLMTRDPLSVRTRTSSAYSM